MHQLTLNAVSGRLQIPRSREELTVAAVGGNLYKFDTNIKISFSQHILIKTDKKTKWTEIKGKSDLSKSSKMTVSGTTSLWEDTASSSVVKP